jgi:hypothetical protein
VKASPTTTRHRCEALTLTIGVVSPMTKANGAYHKRDYTVT